MLGAVAQVITLVSPISAQSLYEIQFSGEQDTTRYKAFLIYYNEKDAFMRISYYNAGKEFRIVEIMYEGEAGKFTNGKSYFSLTGKTPRFITRKNETENYHPDYFVWIGDETLPYTSDTFEDSTSRRVVRRVTSYRRVKPSRLTEEFLSSFFLQHEENYTALLEMNKRANSNPEFNEQDATLHLIILANTRIRDIGSGCKVDVEHLEDEFEGITSRLGIAYNKKILSGLNFNKEQLLQTLSVLPVSRNDIVVFVYRGHGFRWSGQTDSYPALALTLSHSVDLSESNTIMASTVSSLVFRKGARLNIVLTDCCNSGNFNPQISESNYLYLQSNASAATEKLRELFMEREGIYYSMQVM